MMKLRYRDESCQRRTRRPGRARQKQRTRADLVAAAREPDRAVRLAPTTVEEAEAAASVSRTTAYRYFPSQQ